MTLSVEPALAASSAYTQFWRDLNEGRAQNEVFKRITKTGQEVWIQAVYAPVKDEMGRVVKIVKIATDVTAEVTANQALKLAVEQAQKVKAAVTPRTGPRQVFEFDPNVSGDFRRAMELAKTNNGIVRRAQPMH